MAKDSSIAAQRTPELPGLVKRGRPSTGKAKTNAERQAAYRNRKIHAPKFEDIERRLSTMISLGADCALDRLAFHYGVTKKAALERLILAAEKSILADLGKRERGASRALSDHFIFSGKVNMTHPPRPDQARLDAVLAAESDSFVTPQSRDEVTKNPARSDRRDAVTKTPSATKSRNAVTKTKAPAKKSDAVTKNQFAKRDPATGKFLPRAVTK